MTVTRYDDVVCLTSWSQDGNGQQEQWWWKVKSTGQILYATFETPKPGRSLREQAVLGAYASPTKAVAVKAVGIQDCEWVSPLEPAFRLPPQLQVPIISLERLHDVRKIKRGVDVVDYEGWKYIHKYMTPSSTQLSYEAEIDNYGRTSGSYAVPKLEGVVTDRGANRVVLKE
jgi:hypothetical protein